MAEQGTRSNVKLTNSRVLALRPDGKVRRIWDSQVSGFMVRITPAGTKSYCVAFQRSDGRKVNVTIGDCANWDVEAARDRARDLRKLHESGRDARAFVQAERKAQDLSDLVDVWRKDYKPSLKASSQVAYESLIRTVILPPLGQRLVKDITYEDVKDLHRKESRDHRTNANRAIAVLSRLLSIAEKEGWRPMGTNPCRQVEKSSEQSRSRVITAAEYARLESTLVALIHAKRLDHAVADLLRFLAFSGLRKSEAMTLTWAGVDTQRNTMRFEDHKTMDQAGPKVLPLNSHLKAILKRREAEKVNAFVWPGLKEDRPLVGLAKMWQRILESMDAKLEDVTPHDLRRTFMTVCTELGYPLAIGDALLGHSLGRIRDVYVNLGSEGIMATASQETADWIAAAMAGKRPKPGQKVSESKISHRLKNDSNKR